MLTQHLLWQGIKLRESEPVTNGLMLPLSIVLHALWPESCSTASPLCPLLAALSNILGLFSVLCQRIAWHPGAHSAKQEWHWAHRQPHKLKCQEGWQCGGLTKTSCHVGPGGWAEQERLAKAVLGFNKHETLWCDVEGCLLGNTDLLASAARQGSAQDIRQRAQYCRETWSDNWTGWWPALCSLFSSLQVCSWWVEPSSTRWWVRGGCRRQTPSATPTSWRGLPSLWRWSADSSMSSWGSENEPALHPSVPSNPLPNCKCHQSPSEV